MLHTDSSTKAHLMVLILDDVVKLARRPIESEAPTAEVNNIGSAAQRDPLKAYTVHHAAQP